MPEITVSCPHCGELLEAPREFIGESVECPTCQSEFEISDPDVSSEEVSDDTPQSDAETADSVGDNIDESRCPNCGADMTSDTVLCFACGFHTGLGKVIETHFG